jgi:hypothetical protein
MVKDEGNSRVVEGDISGKEVRLCGFDCFPYIIHSKNSMFV